MVTSDTISKRRILIIGSGQIGVFSAKRLQDSGAHVFIADIAPQGGFINRYGSCEEIFHTDITDPIQVERLFVTVKPHIVIMAYGISTKEIHENEKTAESVNVTSVHTIVTHAIRFKVERLIYTSSFAVYQNPGSKKFISEEDPFQNNSLYAAHKIKAEAILRNNADTNLKIIILRLCGSYGPNMYNKGSQSSRFIESLILLAENKRKINLVRTTADEFIYVKDIAKAIATCCHTDFQEQVSTYNISSGLITQVNDIKHALNENFGSVVINLVEDERVHAEKVPLSIEKAKNELTFYPDYNLSEGIRDFKQLVNFKME